MELTDLIKRNIIQAAEHPRAIKGYDGVYLKYEDPSEEMVDMLKKAGINLMPNKRIEIFFVPNEVLERFRKEVEE